MHYLAKNRAILAAVGTFFCFGFVAFLNFDKINGMLNREIKVQSRILFEVKVIDESGRPVQGATVEKDDVKVGITDSFGEWRRYLQAESGSNLNLKISKKVGREMWKSSKKFFVPEVKRNLFALDDKNLKNFEIKTSLKAAKINLVQKEAKLISVK